MTEPNFVPAPPPLSHAHRAPPPHIREVHKRYQKVPLASLSQDEFLLDFGGDGVSEYHETRLRITGRIPRMRVENVCRDFEGSWKTQQGARSEEESPLGDDVLIYKHSSVPGNYSSASPHIAGVVNSHLLCFRLLYNPLPPLSLNPKITPPPSPIPPPLQPAT